MKRPEMAWGAAEEALLRMALEEDLGGAGDATTEALVDEGAGAEAEIRAREPLTVAGRARSSWQPARRLSLQVMSMRRRLAATAAGSASSR